MRTELENSIVERANTILDTWQLEELLVGAWLLQRQDSALTFTHRKNRLSVSFISAEQEQLGLAYPDSENEARRKWFSLIMVALNFGEQVVPTDKEAQTALPSGAIAERVLAQGLNEFAAAHPGEYGFSEATANSYINRLIDKLRELFGANYKMTRHLLAPEGNQMYFLPAFWQVVESSPSPGILFEKITGAYLHKPGISKNALHLLADFSRDRHLAEAKV